jgi:threonine/homoserine/homoserine lactone efflux protein
MLLVSLAFVLLAILVFRYKRPAEAANSSRLYRVDNRVIGSILVILALTFAVLAYTSGRPLF